MKFLNMRFALLTGAVVIAAAVGAVVLPHAGQSQEAAQTPAATGDAWVNRCEDLKDGEKVVGKYCEAFQRLSVMQKDAAPETAQRLAEFAIGYPPVEKGDAKAKGALILPLGILVNQKTKIAIDGKDAMEFSVRYCDNGGCVAVMDLSNGLIDKLRKGNELTIKAEAATGQPVNITMSLKGLATALDKAKPKA
jgi:invasion protein IalB